MKCINFFCISSLVLISSFLVFSSSAAVFTIQNQCAYTVWAAAIPGGGRRLDAGQTWTIDVISGTNGGRGSGYTITFCPASSDSSEVPTPSNLPGDARNVIRPGDKLNSSSKLVSENGNFTLGFFTVLQTNLSYLGIWYSADEQRRVWVANPDSPIAKADREIELVMENTGRIMIFSGGKYIRFVTHQDSGQLVIRRRGVIYWTSDPWNNQGFPLLPLLNASSNRFVEKLNLTSADDGMFFTFETMGTSLSMLTLSPEGQIVDVANNGLIVSPYKDFCYGYERDNGCASSGLPTCRSNKTAFQSKSGSFVGDNGDSDANSSISLSECMEKCWKDCNCNGFTVNSNGTGCITWTKTKKFRIDESGQTMKKYVLAAEIIGKLSKGKSVGKR
ncbi:OLC1v1031078C1 [Oldenlandia corymbosa var. corymbosa]|uniref:OLC1v1031078C1 n=1 Tax=Oldenlandia corymbosa var. corymbosa TaxID=529605 RepID=A0AAV1CHM0_OLDCO|nr:OLC1v1031078C1 [Oldenlandia corymbosa var. corymbosa]